MLYMLLTLCGNFFLMFYVLPLFKRQRICLCSFFVKRIAIFFVVKEFEDPMDPKVDELLLWIWSSVMGN